MTPGTYWVWTPLCSAQGREVLSGYVWQPFSGVSFNLVCVFMYWVCTARCRGQRTAGVREVSVLFMSLFWR